MKALILTHEPNEGPASFGDVLKARGFKQEIIFTPEDDLSALDMNADLVLIMGGPMGVYEANKYPYLTKEIEFIKARITANRPLLGVCLGAQLMAAALGANVYKGKTGQEIGWFDIKINDAGKKTPVSVLDGMMFHWHGDTFDLPNGATLLATSEKYAHQIFSYGDKALALQCHPEVKADELEGWYTAFAGQINEDKIKKLRLETQKNIVTLNAKAKIFFESWLESINL